MTTAEFLAQLRHLEVKLWVDGESLRFSAPAGVMDAELRAQLVARKTEIRDLLHSASSISPSTYPPVTVAPREGELPLSFAQQRLWFLEQLEAGSSVYAVPSAIRLVGKLDCAAVERALNTVTARHEALRTTFATSQGWPIQVIAPSLELSLPVDDLHHLGPHARAAAVQAYMESEAAQPFALDRGPLIRARLLRLADSEHVLLLNLHHIVTDGWSVRVLIQELATLYPALQQGQTPSLPPLAVQYPDYAIWQRRYLTAELLEQPLAYWRECLAGMPTALNLPTDHPRPAVQSFRGGYVVRRLPAELTAELQRLADHHGGTLFMVLLAAFQAVLARYSGQTDLAVGTPVANRPRRELEDLIGFFVNTLVLRTDLSANPSFAELLARVKETCLGAYSHQDVPFEKLVDELRLERDPSRNPLVQAVFAFENAARQQLTIPGISFELLEAPVGSAKFDLTLLMTETSDRGLHARMEYSTDLFEAETIERLLGHFHSVLQAVVAQPNARLADLPLLSDSEQHQLLDWTATTQPYPELGVHQLFEHHAALTPEATALVWGDDHQHLSYAQLNAQANQLAHHLLTLGVTPEARVGVCLERSPQAIVALLAILKAGAAYVPLDPGYPPDRLAFMLADANISLLLSRRDLAHHLPLPTSSSSASSAAAASSAPSSAATVSQAAASSASSSVDAESQRAALSAASASSSLDAESQGAALSTSSASASADDAALSASSSLDAESQGAALSASSASSSLDAESQRAALSAASASASLDDAAHSSTSSAGAAEAQGAALSAASASSSLDAESQRAALTTSSTSSFAAASQVALSGPALLCLDASEIQAALACQPLTNPALATPPSPDHLAYVIYTSGSTGRPKGAAVTHRGIVRLVCHPNFASLSPDQVFLQFAPLAFDASTLEIWGALANGARLALPPASELLSLAQLGHTLRHFQVTTLWLTAGLFHQMVESQLDDLRGLHQLLAGGDVLSVPHVQRVLRELPNCQLINGYGPTECTTFSTCFPLSPDADFHFASSVPIGRPITNTQVYVLDPRRQLVPIGVPGELFIGGPGLARGYLDQPDLTAERFVPNPFQPGTRLYRSGDLVRWRPDGLLDFLGRLDHQVKIRGFRIEPAEIEAVLTTHPAVRDAAVVPLVDGPVGARLVAYLVPADPDQPPATADLRAFVRERLPEYMLPSAFVSLAALPLSPNGKLDRAALPAPDGTPTTDDTAFVAPRTPVEHALAAIWADVLGLPADHIGIHHNFFELGGDSIQTIRVVARAAEAGLSLAPRHLFQHQTVEALAAVVSSQAPTDAVAETAVDLPSDFGLANLDQATIDRLFANHGDLETAYPLSPTQQGMLFHTLLAPESDNYFVQLTWTLRGNLDASSYATAWQRLLDRHPIMRTAVVWEGLDQPLQVVYRQVAAPCEGLDWRAIPANEQQPHLESWLAADRAHGFDFAHPPLMRLALIRLADDTYQCVWSVHHILLDGWSMALLLKELFVTYQALVQGAEPDALLVGSRPFEDYIAWLQRQDMDQAERYWRQTLDGVSEPTPLALAQLPLATSTGAEVERRVEQRIQLSAATTSALISFVRQHRLTLNTLFQGAWAVLLGRAARTDDVVFGATVAGRPAELAGVDSMIGMFITTLPVRTQLASDTPVLDWLRALHAAQVEQSQYEYSPLLDIQRWSDVPRGRPVFESIVVFENYPAEQPWHQQLARTGEAGALEVSDARGVGRTNYPLELVVYPDEQLTLEICHDPARFPPETASRILGQLQVLLESITTHPNQPLGALELLPAAERQNVVVDWNATAQPYPDACVHELFEQQVARTPHALALLDGPHQLTYAKLNTQANQLAHHLRSLGVGPEARVAVCLDRSAQAIVALLGVLKAGGAYVPLDPAYPAERLAFMLDDAGVQVVLTRADLAASLASTNAQLVCLDAPADRALIGAQPTANLGQTATPANLAYVIYTSGSTGRPKGVQVAHRGLANATVAWASLYSLHGGGTRHLQMASFSFDVFTGDLVRALCSGGTLVLCPRELLLEPERLYSLLCQQAITHAEFVPAVLRHLVRYLEENELSLPPMQALAVGSDIWHVADQHALRRRCLPGTRIFNSYGLTEATIDSLCYAAEFAALAAQGTVPIGQPLANTQAYVLDERRRPVPIGVAGELFIGGPGLARGYLGRPELTAERFVPHPFGAAGDRLYRTGDLVRWRADGQLEFLGRLDHQVKIRGFRIEPAEIEAVLANHPLVREAAVVPLTDGAVGARLVAYVVPIDASAALDGPELRNYLRERMPEYMLPSAFVGLAALPLTANRKLDRAALPAPDGSSDLDAMAFVAPCTALERAMATIWAEVLGIPVDRVGTQQNFFELGGHSLLATQLVVHVRDLLQAEISLRALFDGPTISGLVELIARDPAEHARIERTAELLLMLSELSDEEAEAMLQKESATALVISLDS